MTEHYPWHEAAWVQFYSRWRSDRAPHALLLLGVAGLGKGHLAGKLAGLLLCESPDLATAPCGLCPGCRLSRAATHPDLRVVSLQEKKTEIAVDQVRETTEFLSLTSQRGRAKVALIEPADRMNIHAANALLKTLEEPSVGSHLILVTSAQGAIPATVRSRCQRLVVHPPERESAVAWLRERRVQHPELMLACSGGAPLLAQRLAGSQRMDVRRNLFETFRSIVQGRSSVLDLSAKCDDSTTRMYLELLVDWIRDMVRLRSTGKNEFARNSDFGTDLATIAGQTTVHELFRRLERAERALGLCNTSVNRALLLEDALLPWCDRGRRG